MKLRSYLVLMILGAILPVAVFGAIAGIFLAQRESETFRRGALDGSFERLVRTGEPVISDLAVGPVLKRWSFAVRVPVFEKDALKYVLSAGVKLEAINRIVDAQDLPRDWVGVVIDRNGRIVARNLAPEQTVGRLASESLREGLAREPSG